jgi:hypothetical protein
VKFVPVARSIIKLTHTHSHIASERNTSVQINIRPFVRGASGGCMAWRACKRVSESRILRPKIRICMQMTSYLHTHAVHAFNDIVVLLRGQESRAVARGFSFHIRHTLRKSIGDKSSHSRSNQQSKSRVSMERQVCFQLNLHG